MSNKGINLVVDNRKNKQLAPLKGKLKIMRLSAMGLLFIVGVSSVILSILIVFSPLPRLQEDEQKAKTNLATYKIEINKIAFINDRGDGIRQILKKRPYYDKKLDVIKNKLPVDVTLDGLTIENKTYTLRFSSNNLASLDQFIDSVVSATGVGKEFLRVYLTSLSVDEDKNRFVLIVDLLTV